MTERTNDAQFNYAEKIAKLLRKAEGTDNPIEAETFTQKAQELMLTYAITEELLAKAQGRQVNERIVQESITYTGVLQKVLYIIGHRLALANNCKTVVSFVTLVKPTHATLTITGFESDVRHVIMMDASVQIQCATALGRWWREQNVSWMTPMQKFKARREFVAAFGTGLGDKLYAANAEARRVAAQEEAARSDVTAEVATHSVELVLRSKKDRVQDWYDERYGRSLQHVTHRYSSGGRAAREAGYDAGRRADVGQSGVSGRRGELGR